MKKKQLNRRQLRRIHDKQAASARRADNHEADGATSSDRAELGPEQTGVVISHFGQQLEIEALGDGEPGRRVRCHQRNHLETLVPGDRVIWRSGHPTGVVEAGLPRHSVLQRPGPSGELRPVAANIDQILIIIAPRPQPFPNLVDRYLVAAESIPVRPTLILNKADLVDDTLRGELEDLLAIYRRIGYPVLQVSARTGQGIDALKRALKDHTSIFVGQSGVGKSALVNALLPGVNTLEGALSEGTTKGRHTTTSARLFHFPDGGDLIDSPGIREFGLWHMDTMDLLQGFVEFRPFLGKCRFRDCRHEGEPGCRLLRAVAEGEVDPARMDSFRRILRDNQS